MSLTEPRAIFADEASEDPTSTFHLVASLSEVVGSNASIVVIGSDRTVHPDEMTDSVRVQFADGLREAAKRTLQAARATSTSGGLPDE